jgi:Glu-tRNA(Gln) amidotransferase subunit E-like FAD-binding protein
VIGFGMIVFLTGCGDSPETQIYNHLEEAVQLEDGFEKQQDKISNLEKKEQDIYKEIIELGIDKLDKIKELSQEAIASIDERSGKIKLEKESLDKSKEEFEKSKVMIDKLKDDDVKKEATSMYNTMEERYDAYQTLNKVYNESLGLEKQLYEMLQLEDLKQEDLQAHIEKLNLKYQEVIKANDTFNDLTTKYNELKKNFYKIANINVKYVDNK